MPLDRLAPFAAVLALLALALPAAHAQDARAPRPDVPLAENDPVLARGATGPEVSRLQRFLDATRRAHSLRPIAVDGHFGPATESAVRRFQRDHGLAPRGRVDDATWRALENAPHGSPDAARSPDAGRSSDYSPNAGHFPDGHSLETPTPAGEPTPEKPYRNAAARGSVVVRRLAAIEVAPSKSERPLTYTAGATIDVDGAGDAYRHDPDGQATTSLRDAHGRSLDPTLTPYVVLPVPFERAHPEVRLGDVVAVEYRGKTIFAIFGDRQTRRKLGEISKRTADELGIPSDPVRGGTDSGVTYTVFPGSGTGRPLSNAEIDARGAALLAKLHAASAPTPGITGAVGHATGE